MARKYSILRSEGFLRNLLYVSGSRAIGIFLGLFFTPIIARLFPPEAYGQYSLFVAFLGNLSVLSTLRFEGTFLLIKERRDLHRMIQGSFSLVLLLSFLLLLLLTILHFSPFEIAAWGDEWLIFLLPLGVFLAGTLQIITNWNVVRKDFKKGAPIGVGSNLVHRGVNVSYGHFFQGVSFGLILGDLIGKFFNILFRWLIIFKAWVPRRFFSIRKEVIPILRAYAYHPKYLLPTAWINKLSTQIPIFLLAAFFLDEELGAYTMTIGLLNIPLQFFSNSLSPVFSQRFSELKSSSLLELNHFFRTFLFGLFYILAVPFALLTVWGDLLIVPFLGEGWELSGEILPFLALLFYFRALSQSINRSYILLKKQKFTFYLNLVRCIVFLITLFIFGYLYRDYHTAIAAYSFVSVLIYTFSFYTLFRLLRIDVRKLFLHLLGFVSILAANLLLRWAFLGFG